MSLWWWYHICTKLWYGGGFEECNA
jgi:hypothetical protein